MKSRELGFCRFFDRHGLAGCQVAFLNRLACVIQGVLGARAIRCGFDVAADALCWLAGSRINVVGEVAVGVGLHPNPGVLAKASHKAADILDLVDRGLLASLLAGLLRGFDGLGVARQAAGYLYLELVRGRGALVIKRKGR